MLLTVERIMILKSVDLFAHTLDKILAASAAFLQEVAAAAGTVLFTQGQPGASMYIIARGAAEALAGAPVFTRLRARTADVNRLRARQDAQAKGDYAHAP